MPTPKREDLAGPNTVKTVDDSNMLSTSNESNKLNVLFIVHRIPYPPNKGDKIRSFNEIKYLSQKHNIYLAFLVDDEKDLSHLDELRRYCIDFDFDVISPRRQKFRSVPYLLSNKPLSVPYFYSKKLQERIDKRLVESKINAVICFSSPMAEYIFRSKSIDVRDVRTEQSKLANNRSDRTSLIMDFVDVDSDKWRMYAGFSKFPFSVVYKREWKTLMSYEQKIGCAFDRSFFVSDKEVELFKSFCPQTRNLALAIPNGVDHEYFNPGDQNQSSKLNRQNQPSILFMGAMDYFPNEDAVLYFSREILPHVKKKVGKVTFHVVGGGLSRKIKKLSESEPDIVLTGYVSDVRPYLTMADVFIAPLRIARGIPNKVLEAMAFGVPVVARPEAVQGLDRYNGCLKVETTEIGFASAIYELLKNSNVRDKVITEARRFVIKNHDWRTNFEKLDEMI